MKKHRNKQENTLSAQLRTFVLFICLILGIIMGFVLYANFKAPLNWDMKSSSSTYNYPIIIIAAYFPIFIFYKLSLGLVFIPLYLFIRGVTCSCAMLSIHQAYISDSMLLLRFGISTMLRLWGLLYFSGFIIKKAYSKHTRAVIEQDKQVRPYFNIILIIILQIIAETIIRSI